MLAVAFLKDILTYLNLLYAKLQGNKNLICDQISNVSAFRRKLKIFVRRYFNENVQNYVY